VSDMVCMLSSSRRDGLEGWWRGERALMPEPRPKVAMLERLKGTAHY
jgi:hypothetical protein